MRDRREARVPTMASLRWVVRHRAWTPYHLMRYWRFLLLKIRHPGVVTEGFVSLDRDVEIFARRGYGRIILGRWVHLGTGTSLRAHEGTLRIGDKVVMGRHNTVNCHLDIEIGEAALFSDAIYVCDFDHVTAELDVPIKDQGIVKSPVRIGPDCWVGTKATVLRGAFVGRGSVLAAHTVVRGEVPAYSIVAGVPGRVVKNRRDEYAEAATERAELKQIADETAEAAAGRFPKRRTKKPAGRVGGQRRSS
ncbi:MAG: acyltransferase [Propionibacteriales bacterium]|nr:acyltransferase [Propionibacteriales bacterium]